MEILSHLKSDIVNVVKELYQYNLEKSQMILNPTKKEFEGDFTFVVFPLVKALSKNPVEIANTIGERLVENSSLVTDFNVIKGFLNIHLSESSWGKMLLEAMENNFKKPEKIGKKILVEFSSPNTNKPLHLGHLRNIFLGWSVAQLAEENGYDVVKTQIINDRGVAICKGMMAWKKTANGATPDINDIKADHFVGKYYVEFDKIFQNEYAQWQETEEAQKMYLAQPDKDIDKALFFKKFKNNYFNEISPLGKETKQMLLDWENGDEDTVSLWKMMNNWVYKGWDVTYDNLNVSFDDLYYESDTYLLGKSTVEKGLTEKVFYNKNDGSVWADLEPDGMDHKILLRSDGTSVYMTQDIGTAQKRNEDHGLDSMVYVVGDEQDYHFKALFAILNKLGEPYADQLHHLSYGMVDLPSGTMKTREGTVVDADELVDEVIKEARKSAEERGGLEGLSEEEKELIYEKIGLAALKYFIIKINPRKRMTFDPKESVDMQGTTGPYIQNAYVRVRSILRKAGEGFNGSFEGYSGLVNEFEKDLIQQMISYRELIHEAMAKYDPSLVANYAYALAKSYHRFYHECRILNAEKEETKQFRLVLSSTVADTLRKVMRLIGIDMPEYM